MRQATNTARFRSVHDKRLNNIFTTNVYVFLPRRCSKAPDDFPGGAVRESTCPPTHPVPNDHPTSPRAKPPPSAKVCRHAASEQSSESGWDVAFGSPRTGSPPPPPPPCRLARARHPHAHYFELLEPSSPAARRIITNDPLRGWTRYGRDVRVCGEICVLGGRQSPRARRGGWQARHLPPKHVYSVRLEAELAEEPLVLARGVTLLEHLLDLLARLSALGRVGHDLRCDAERLEVHLDGITADAPRATPVNIPLISTMCNLNRKPRATPVNINNVQP